MDTYVTKHVQWPHEMFFTTQGQATVYSDISIALFTNAYLAAVTGDSMSNKKHILVHLQELMEDVEVYWWRIVREYCAAWLQLLEQGWATWGDATKKDKLWMLLIWSNTSLGIKTPAPNGAPILQPTLQAQGYRCRQGSYSQASEMGDKACLAYN